MTKLATFLAAFCACIYHLNANYTYETRYIDLPVDHFSFTTNKTFRLRYLYNDSFWNHDGCIFFYTGNEGDINLFAQNTGFMWELAPEYEALLVFAEHRYYGESLPFGNESFTNPQHLGFLTSSQALADFVYLIDFLQGSSLGARKSPVVAFGGSYGGMLAAWLRIKYPASVIGAIASSAPIFQFEGLTPCHLYDDIVTQVFKVSSTHDCSIVIKKSWSAIREIGKTPEGKAWLNENWKLCKQLKTDADIDLFIEWLESIYGDLAMVNYPYPTNFLAPLPAYPVKAVCDRLQNKSLTGKPLILAIKNAISVYTNYTGDAKCVNTGDSSDRLGFAGWDFQACTEMIMPMCSRAESMFEFQEWNFTNFAQNCYKEWGVQVKRADEVILTYGGKHLKAASNIVFSNGLMDPWSAGGVLQDVSKTVIAAIMPEAAHHLDLRASNKYDPYSVTETRNIHKHHINSWLKSYHKSKHFPISLVCEKN